MRYLVIASLVSVTCGAQPGIAAPMLNHPSAAQHRIGAFAGARFRMAIGGKQAVKPRIGVALSGIHYQQSAGLPARVRFAEGAEFGFAAGRVGLSLAGRPVSLEGTIQGDPDHTYGISTVALVAGGAVIALGVGALLFVDAMNDASE